MVLVNAIEETFNRKANPEAEKTIGLQTKDPMKKKK